MPRDNPRGKSNKVNIANYLVKLRNFASLGNKNNNHAYFNINENSIKIKMIKLFYRKKKKSW